MCFIFIINEALWFTKALLGRQLSCGNLGIIARLMKLRFIHRSLSTGDLLCYITEFIMVLLKVKDICGVHHLRK